MFKKRKARRSRRLLSAEAASAGAAAVVDDAMLCAAQLQSLGNEIDAYRRRGEAAIGAEPGPEVQVLRDRQNEIMTQYLERTLRVKRDDREALDGACRRLREIYRGTHGDLVTGRALWLVERVLEQDPH